VIFLIAFEGSRNTRLENLGNIHRLLFMTKPVNVSLENLGFETNIITCTFPTYVGLIPLVLILFFQYNTYFGC
jgi:hypothetical protein